MSVSPAARSFIIRNFHKDRTDASRAMTTATLRKKLVNLYPTITRIQKANREDDMNGVDFWVMHPSGRFGVDVKIMSIDPIQTYKQNNVILELNSDVRLNSPGWTCDANHITDVVVWYYVPTGRVFILDYRPLREAFITNVMRWSHGFMKPNNTEMPNGYLRTSQAVRVPVNELLDAMKPFQRRRFGIELTEGVRFCRMPNCAQSAMYPADDVEPIWCGAHYNEVAPREVEIAKMAVRRAEMEEMSLKNKMRDLAEYRAKKASEATRPKLKKGADLFTIAMELEDVA